MTVCKIIIPPAVFQIYGISFHELSSPHHDEDLFPDLPMDKFLVFSFGADQQFASEPADGNERQQ